MFVPIKILLLILWTAQGTRATVIPNHPENCNDILKQGETHEGYYVVYPGASKHASMIYCSQEDGMEVVPLDKKEFPKNCNELQGDSGVYVIYPDLENPNIPVMVHCDMVTDGGGYTYIHNRFDGSVDFYRGWDEFAAGFGNPAVEHWLGNKNIAHLTGQGVTELLVELEAFDGEKVYAHYDMFIIKYSDYKLQHNYYSGNATDSLIHVEGMPFSTYDNDNDGDSGMNCVDHSHGAWWHHSCTFANLNGRYYSSAEDENDSMYWGLWRSHESLKSASMKVRPYTGKTRASTNNTMGVGVDRSDSSK